MDLPGTSLQLCDEDNQYSTGHILDNLTQNEMPSNLQITVIILYDTHKQQ